ncbi:hypothetical protein BC941DRAFT_431085 [Chlamydoabsidia padenii]|nr:hypothetical protein BC941DRAFT_431085 [Chlamydoabsidia padenii]
MADKSTSETIRNWLLDEFNTPGWHSAVVAQELSEDILDTVSMQFTGYDKATKIGILLSLLHIRKGELAIKLDNVTKIIGFASQDQDEWVRLLGDLLYNFPTTKRLNLGSNEWSNQAQSTLNNITNTVHEKGLGFHPDEFMMIQQNAWPACHYTNDSYKSNEPTLVKHFQLGNNKDVTISDTERQSRFNALIQAEDDMMALESPLTSPTYNTSNRFPIVGSNNNSNSSSINTDNNVTYPMAATGSSTGRPPPALYNRGSVDGRTNLRPPPPRPRPGASASSSLFIQRPMLRKPSLGSDSNKPSFLRPSGPARFNRPPPANPSSLYTNPAPPRSTMPRPEGSIPKGFIKQSRVQMLDFDNATRLQEDNTKAIDTAKQDAQNEKEAKKQQAAEERRIAAEKRKAAAQKEKEEREASKRRKHSQSNATGETKDEQNEPSELSPQKQHSSPATSPPLSANTSPVSVAKDDFQTMESGYNNTNVEYEHMPPN